MCAGLHKLFQGIAQEAKYPGLLNLDQQSLCSALADHPVPGNCMLCKYAQHAQHVDDVKASPAGEEQVLATGAPLQGPVSCRCRRRRRRRRYPCGWGLPWSPASEAAAAAAASAAARHRPRTLAPMPPDPRHAHQQVHLPPPRQGPEVEGGAEAPAVTIQSDGLRSWSLRRPPSQTLTPRAHKTTQCHSMSMPLHHRPSASTGTRNGATKSSMGCLPEPDFAGDLHFTQNDTTSPGRMSITSASERSVWRQHFYVLCGYVVAPARHICTLCGGAEAMRRS